MMEWTPGPWEWVDKSTLVGDGSMVVFTKFATAAEVNLRLIAAAPEMAELLAQLVETMDGHPESCRWFDSGGDQAERCDCGLYPARALLDRIAGKTQGGQ